MGIFDTTGLKKFHERQPAYFRGKSGIMMVYDITRRESFENIRWWKRLIDEHKEEGTVVMLVGCKCHLEEQRQVSIEEGMQLADEFGILFFETSSQKFINVVQDLIDNNSTKNSNKQLGC